MRKRKDRGNRPGKFLDSIFFQSFPPSKTKPLDDYNLRKLKSNLLSHQSKRGDRVSDFTGWIYDSLIGKRSNTSLSDGNRLESIFAKDIYIITYDGGDYMGGNSNIYEKIRRDSYEFLTDEWELEFEDISSKKRNSYEISRLLFNGNKMKGKPDVVYRNTRTNDRIIIEIKNTGIMTNIPVGGWYNVQCQLWAYSWIDDFIDSPNIYLYGDIRTTSNKTDSDGRRIMKIYPSNFNTFWRIRKNGELNMEKESVAILHEQSQQIFELYGGVFTELDND